METPVNLSFLYTMIDLPVIRLLINITTNHKLVPKKTINNYLKSVDNCDKPKLIEMLDFCDKNNVFIRNKLLLIPPSNISKKSKNLLLLDHYIPFYYFGELELNHWEVVAQLIKLLKTMAISKHDIYHKHIYHYKLYPYEIRDYLLSYFDKPHNETFKKKDIKLIKKNIELFDIKHLHCC